MRFSVRRLAVLGNVGHAGAANEMREVQTAAKALGVEIDKLEIRRAEDIATALLLASKSSRRTARTARNSPSCFTARSDRKKYTPVALASGRARLATRPLQRKAPGERENLNRGPSVPRGSWGREGTPPTIIKQRGAEPRFGAAPLFPFLSVPTLGRRRSAIGAMKLRLG